jgi:transposase
MSQAFASDLTQEQWDLIQPLLPKARPGGRPRTTNLRSVVNAVLYLNRTGCQWRYLPKCFPPYQTVYDYFKKWKDLGTWLQIYFTLYFRVRVKEHRNVYPSLAIVDSQSAKVHFGESRARDGFKKVIGRKRSILVDSLGFLICCHVHKGNDQDWTGLELLMEKLPKPFKISLQKIIGDMGYRLESLKDLCGKDGIEMEPIDQKKYGTNMKPKRWIVERTFAWLNHFRRHSRDYEKKTSSSEMALYITHMQLLLKRAF